jgi:NADH pyrophosphatase NudC (nudix superfamily)
MITKEHLKIFKSFDGDIDMWGRMKKSNEEMTDAIWFEIEEIIQNLTIINNRQASEEFITRTLQHIKTSCENPEVEQELIKISKGSRN